MGFTLYRVDADLTEYSEMVAGVSATCQTMAEAMEERDKLEANPRYCNVRIERRQYGGPSD